MKNNKVNNFKIKKDIINFLVSLVTIFSVMVTCYVAVSWFVYNQFNIHFYYLILIALISCISSILISLFVKINKISFIGQVSVVYSIVCLSCLGVVLLLNSNIINKPMFWYITFIASFVGLGVLIIVLVILKHREEQKLNDVLNNYKGNNKDEKENM